MTHGLHTFVTTLLAFTPEVHLDQVTVEQDTVRLQLKAMAPTAACPRCAVSSSSVYSRYQRHPAFETPSAYPPDVLVDIFWHCQV
jgi:hypothetical protein